MLVRLRNFRYDYSVFLSSIFLPKLLRFFGSIAAWSWLKNLESRDAINIQNDADLTIAFS